MGKFKDLTGKRFGRLTVLSLSHMTDRAFWLCQCDCGKTKVITSYCLGKFSNSCGCWGKDHPSRFVHGDHHSPEYSAWCRIRSRCFNKDSPDYPDYGGRGIIVCDRWLESYQNFLEDMGRRPSSIHSIDRIDNDGNYTPDNCRWATRIEQARNKRTSLKIEYKGQVKPLKEWCSLIGINYNKAYQRLKISEWPVDKIFSQ